MPSEADRRSETPFAALASIHGLFYVHIGCESYLVAGNSSTNRLWHAGSTHVFPNPELHAYGEELKPLAKGPLSHLRLPKTDMPVRQR
jgi:hypothetical protein